MKHQPFNHQEQLDLLLGTVAHEPPHSEQLPDWLWTSMEYLQPAMCIWQAGHKKLILECGKLPKAGKFVSTRIFLWSIQDRLWQAASTSSRSWVTQPIMLFHRCRATQAADSINFSSQDLPPGNSSENLVSNQCNSSVIPVVTTGTQESLILSKISGVPGVHSGVTDS